MKFGYFERFSPGGGACDRLVSGGVGTLRGVVGYATVLYGEVAISKGGMLAYHRISLTN